VSRTVHDEGRTGQNHPKPILSSLCSSAYLHTSHEPYPLIASPSWPGHCVPRMAIATCAKGHDKGQDQAKNNKNKSRVNARKMPLSANKRNCLLVARRLPWESLMKLGLPKCRSSMRPLGHSYPTLSLLRTRETPHNVPNILCQSCRIIAQGHISSS